MIHRSALLATATAAVLLTGLASPGFAQAKDMNNNNTSATHATTGAASDTGDKTATSAKADARPIEELQRAAQRLRDATHDMVRESANTKRNKGIRKVDRTLEDVQDAMVSLPSNLFLAGSEQSESQKAADNLQRATDRLNAAAQALKADGSGDQSASIKEIKQALAQVQQERMNLANQSAAR